MDEYPPTPKKQSPASNGTGNRLHALAFLEVGIFEFFFVAVALLLLFGTLNYFNILSISHVFPNQLSWLPRKEVSSGTSQNISLKNQRSAILPTPIPTSTPTLSQINS